jgi:uncharacterized protein
MSVKDRLKRMTGEGGSPVRGDASQREIIGELRKKIDAIMTRRESYPQKTVAHRPREIKPLQEVITGEEVENARGKCWFSRFLFRGPTSHGSSRIAGLAEADMDAAALLAGHPDIRNMSISDALFLDTETTGLAGGTGTLAFLVGLGWFEGEDFVVYQLFTRDYHEEGAMLTLLSEIARDKSFLVTFNGRGFDLTLLAARYILNRLPDPLSAMPHLDLLFPSRRLLAHRLENCRLVTLESEVLGLTRVGDVPGFEIPGRYFDWLRTKDASPLEEVFHHNRLDIVSMAALVMHLSRLVSLGEGHHESDILAAARLHLRQGCPGVAQAFLESLLDSSDPLVTRDARATLSLASKRRGLWEDAVAVWEGMLELDPHDLFAALELAKWLEHRKSDFTRAIGIVERILEAGQRVSPEDRDALANRLARLKRKKVTP